MAEDTAIAKAYAKAMTEAAVGTDQDLDTYYGKMYKLYKLHAGAAYVSLRTVNSIKSRSFITSVFVQEKL